ncbi:MAG: penicillin acylase family protein [Bacillus sp. (in: firmicutes)]
MESGLGKPKRKGKRRWRKAAVISFSAVVLLLLLAVGAAGYTLKKPLPKTEGQVQLKGLGHTVEVVRDSRGVPHIKADNEKDLYLAQGYIQAQDRLFQMDLSRRQASGRLSEVIGTSTVENDKFFRTLGLRRAAESSLDSYTEKGKEVLKWFADGVNLYMEEAIESNKLPVEFLLLGYEPEPWTPVDSLTIGKYMAYDLGGNWENQAFRQYLVEEFPDEKAYDLFPSYPENAPYIIGSKELDISRMFADAVIAPEYNGSNNWVVGGIKTKSGKPLLADDPHLSLATPSIWYQMHLNSPGVNVSGVIFAGIPGIILGHNETIAWGVTNTGPDVQDLYIEKRNPKNKQQFLYKGEWEQASIFNEPIKIKDEETLDYKVTVTRHGPIISEFAEATGQEHVLALKWTALEPSAELEAILNMNKAGSWEEFERALEKFNTPAQNFVYADKKGDIAFKANGNIPLRTKGDSLLPVPGWTGEYEWDGYIPYDELPRTVNPKEGFISTANNKVIDDSYPYHISHHWAQPYRQMRIREVLMSNNPLEVEDMKALQMDVKNLQAEEFLHKFLALIPEQSGIGDNAISVLENWDFQDDQNEAAPLIFHFWMSAVSDVLFEESIPEDVLDLFKGRKAAVDQLLRNAIDGNPGPWIEEKDGLAKVLEASFDQAIDKMTDLQGKTVREWKWGDFHQVRFDHPLSAVTPLKYLFNPSGGLAVGGSSVTVQAAANKKDGTVNHGGSWRFIADLSDLGKAYHLVGPGQSGHVQSDHYNDQFEDWAEGLYHETDIEGYSGEKLLLLP